MADDRSRQLDKSRSAARNEKKNKEAEKPDEQKKSKKIELGLIGGILFGGFVAGSIALDALPIFTGCTSAVIDWILDACLGLYGGIMLVIITGDPFEGLVSRRAASNFVGWGVESFLPLADCILPTHILVAVVIFLDFKYNILDFKKIADKV